MQDILPWFFGIASVTFGLTLFVLLVFPVEVYENYRDSSTSDSIKGLFAQTVNSFYHLKKDGLSAEPKYWWHLFWFNTTVSGVVSVVVAVGLIVIFYVVVTIIVLFVLFGMLSN